jgi:hypothetical protein
VELVPFPVKVKINVRIKIKVKGDGQECPSHTGKVKGNRTVARARFEPLPVTAL